MPKRHPSYESIRATAPNPLTPTCNAIVVYWNHMEKVHAATPEDYGMNVLGWHRRNHSDCTTLPPYGEAKKVDYKDEAEQIERVVAQMVGRQICDELTARSSLDNVLNAFRGTTELSKDLGRLCENARLKSKGI